MSEPAATGVYGHPPPALATAPAGARQFSPLVPGAEALESLAPASLTAAVVAAPPGTLERRYVLALMLRALNPGAPLIALAPRAKGGARLHKELEAFGCRVDASGRQHQRICRAARPQALVGIETAITEGGPRRSESGIWTQPGVFSWDRDDPGSQLLVAALPALSGQGADLGCGAGVLARAVLSSQSVTRLHLVDLDRRALDAARRNVEDPRACLHWADLRGGSDLAGLDFVVMNPPFHADGLEDRALGQVFIRRGHEMLRPGGVLWMVANRRLPYEAVLGALFSRVAAKGEGRGFKICEARK